MLKNMSQEIDSNRGTTISNRIEVYLHFKVDDPRVTPIKREPNERFIKVLALSDEGSQTLVIIKLPSKRNGTVQDCINTVR